MDQKGYKWINKGWNIWKGGFGTKKPVFTQFLEHLEHLENPDSFEIIPKIGSHLEKSGQFWNHPEKLAVTIELLVQFQLYS